MKEMKKKHKNFWFKRKRYGWGWQPASFAGWSTLIIYIAATFANFTVARDTMESLSPERLFVFGFLTVLLILICYKTGEKPRWQWAGKPTKK